MRHLTGFIILLFVSFHARAQVGGLAGAVTDAITGRELVGVVVSLKPAGKEDVTDVEGRFLFNNLQPGIYSLELSQSHQPEERRACPRERKTRRRNHGQGRRRPRPGLRTLNFFPATFP